jgi:hypothetical protein
MVIGNPVYSFPFYDIVVNRKVLFNHFPDVIIASAITNPKERRKDMIVLLKCFRIVWTVLPQALLQWMINETMIQCWNGSLQFFHEIGAICWCTNCLIFHSGLNKKGQSNTQLTNFNLRGKMYHLVYCLSMHRAIFTSIGPNLFVPDFQSCKYYWSMLITTDQ